LNNDSWPDKGPQQMLLSYSDFQPQQHNTILEYNDDWYITKVTDAKGHWTRYDRGDPPPNGIGEIKKIIHENGSYIEYTYSDHGHYITFIRDENTNLTSISRDGSYRITRIDYPSNGNTPLSYEEFLQYNSLGQATVHHMRNGAYERFAYDSRGLLTDKWNPQDHIPLQGDPHTHYDYYTAADGKPGWIDRVKTVTMPANCVLNVASETYEYDKKSDNTPVAGRGLVTKMTHADAKSQTFRYNQWGNKVQECNELTECTTYAYDDYNRVLTATKIMSPLPDETTTYTYTPTNGTGTSPYLHTTNNPDTITSPSGIMTSNVYDENFRKTSSTVAGRTTRYGYDNVGNPTTVTDPLIHTTTTDYDDRNRKSHVWDALNHQTTFRYDDASNVRYIDRPDGTTEEKRYDALNRVIRDIMPYKGGNSAVNLVTIFEYNPSGTIQKVTLSNDNSNDPNPNHWTTFDYDASDRRTTLTYQNGETQSWAYDDAGNLKGRWTVAGSIQFFAYDNRNRKYAEEWWDRPSNSWAEWRYFALDDASRLRRVQNGTGDFFTHTISDVHRNYDHAGRLTLDQQHITGLDTKNVHYEHNVSLRGSPTRMYVTDASYDYDFRYDDMGRFEQILVHGAANPAFQYYYDDASNETQRRNWITGIKQFYTPDSLNRIGLVDLQKNSSFAHEAYLYDSMNRLTSVTREDNKQDQFGYYRDGELNWVLYGVSPTPTPAGSATPTPPPSGSATPTPTPGGGTVATPTFAPGGGNIYPYYTVTVAISTTTSGAQIRYTLDGTNWTVIANGASVSFNPGPGKTLTAIGFKSGMADSPPHSEDYYRDNGNGPGIEEKEKTVDDLLSMPDGMNTETLDTANRAVTYAYDKAGNRTTVGDTLNGNTSYTPNNINQYINSIGGYAITNSPEHQIASYRNAIYTYFEDEHLARVASGTSTYDLAYDALGRCVKRTVHTDQEGDVTKYYIYDGERPILEYKSTGNLAAHNLYGKGVDEILKRIDYTFNPVITFYLQQDHEGSVTHVTDADGHVIERYRYDAFGAPTIYPPSPSATPRPASIVSNRFLFTGREYAANFGFYEYRARAYHPGLGRFMSEDPKGVDAGDYNLFRYCHNDPIDFTDPMGLDGPDDNPAISHGAVAKAIDRAYGQIMARSQWSNSGAIAAGMSGYQSWSTLSKAVATAEGRSGERGASSNAGRDSLYWRDPSGSKDGYVPMSSELKDMTIEGTRAAIGESASVESHRAVWVDPATGKLMHSTYRTESEVFQGGQRGYAPTPKDRNLRIASDIHAHTRGNHPISGDDYHTGNAALVPMSVGLQNRQIWIYRARMQANPGSFSKEGLLDGPFY
jgi:RHS repeat-associated protein